MAIAAMTDPAKAPALAAAALIEAAELERRRLERDLHDHAERRLLALARLLEQLPSGAVEEADGIAAARRELDAALRDLRELVHSLHPAALARHGLRVAIDALAARSPIPVAVSVDVPERPPAAVEIAAYYLVADALADAAAHAGACRAAVVVRLRDGELLVEVGDDGSGVDPTSGRGLHGLADRIASLGGSLDVSGSSGLRARIPARVGSPRVELAA